VTDDFVYQRRQDVWDTTSTNTKKPSRFTRPPGRENPAVTQPETLSPQKEVQATRKILAPKSTNSPAKRRVHVSEKLKDNGPNPAIQATTRAARLVVPPPEKELSSGNPPDVEKNLPPKTPAADADALMSPLSTEPSARNTLQPKEAAVLNSVEDVLNGSIGRGSRRARAAVSYAEPNLRDKMRRPGKELVGAVEGLERTKENSSSTKAPSSDTAKLEDHKNTEEQVKTHHIKHEKDANAEEKWRELPMRKAEEAASPLRDKNKKERVASHSRHSTQELEKGVDLLSIFDPPVSSPAEPPSEAAAEENGQKMPATARRKPSTSTLTSRRHSTQPSSSSTVLSVETEASSLNASAPSRRISSTRAPIPRPTSAASTRSERMASIANDLKRTSSVNSSMKRREPNEASEAVSETSSRTERTLNRRRSMMV
jgi:hypothetical protein